MRKLLRGLAAATALSLAPVAATVSAAPAQAAETVATAVQLSSGIDTRGVHGDRLSITANVVTSQGGSPLDGASVLQRLAPGARAWVTVATDTSAGFSYFPGYDKFLGNAAFRVVFKGGVSGDRTYLPSVSPIVKIQTERVVTPKDVSKRSPRLKITVKPGFGGKKVVLQGKKKGGQGWKNLRKVRTNRSGVAFVSVKGNRRGIPYRIVVPGDRNYVKTVYGFRARSY